jgi:uncharacterized membrane protein YhhN
VPFAHTSLKKSGGGMMDLVVLSILAVSVIASVHYGWVATLQPASPARTLQKTLAVSLLALVAWRLGGSGFLVAGLALSAIGDALLAGPGQRRFLVGVLAFAAAHGCYIPLFLETGIGTEPVAAWRWAIVGLLGAGASALLFGLLWPKLGKMRAPLSAYFTIILIMGALAWLIPASQLAGLVVALGATLFVASDAMLGWEMFGRDQSAPASPLLSRAVWFLYYGGQALICWGGVRLI